MQKAEPSASIRTLLLSYQQAEITDHSIYSGMARREKNPDNKAVLLRIAEEEREHAAIWQQYTGQDARPKRFTIWWCTFLSFLLGYTFVMRRMEQGEYKTSKRYEKLIGEIPEAEAIILQEQRHEATLNDMLDEDRLKYVGAMVLGLNDALVELTGTIAGLTFALTNTRIVALSGIITGVSATLSMAASNYLAERADGNPNALKSCIYTGVAYLVTVALLVLPYLLYPAEMYVAALATMLIIVILIIFLFNYYISVAKMLPFRRRFLEMAGISLGVALISFVIGLLVKKFLGIDI